MVSPYCVYAFQNLMILQMGGVFFVRIKFVFVEISAPLYIEGKILFQIAMLLYFAPSFGCDQERAEIQKTVRLPNLRQNGLGVFLQPVIETQIVVITTEIVVYPENVNDIIAGCGRKYPLQPLIPIAHDVGEILRFLRHFSPLRQARGMERDSLVFVETFDIGGEPVVNVGCFPIFLKNEAFRRSSQLFGNIHDIKKSDIGRAFTPSRFPDIFHPLVHAVPPASSHAVRPTENHSVSVR